MIALLCGGIGLISVFFITNKWMLFASMAGVGIAWASILSMPYVMLSTAVPPARMGVYMGVFNLFIVIPQIVMSLIVPRIYNNLLGGDPRNAVVLGGISLLIAAVTVLVVRDVHERSVKPRITRIVCGLILVFWSRSRVLWAQPRPVRDWVRDGVIYEIYPRAFSQQGNFNAITARLDELKDLGVTILWLMPIHPIGQEKKKGTIGSPYAVRDYYGINPDYGTADDLKRLVREAHARGLKVIIDIVANHTSWDSVLMKHPEFYKRDAKGNITYPYDWYDIAALNYGNQELRRYMTDMLKYWLREFDLDGFRCDVAGEVPTDFWENARVELEQIKPDIVMLAEAHKAELQVKAFDLDYSWPLHSALTNVLQGRAPCFRSA